MQLTAKKCTKKRSARAKSLFCLHVKLLLRDGPLENLWGGAGEVQKKNSRKGKLNEKKFLQAN